ncbi:MAG TPA: cobalamin-binding protein [Pirellulales bacterium]|nr:cobalamin-binding protein [Pirellulales bacterium]
MTRLGDWCLQPNITWRAAIVAATAAGIARITTTPAMTMPRGPQRIACLTAETVDLLYRLGVEDRIVGVSGFTRFPPEARQRPFVSAFTTIHYDVIESLRPDLIIGFSDLQADAMRELARRGYQVLLTNQRTLSEAFETMLLIGRVVDRANQAEQLVASLQATLDAARGKRSTRAVHPRVYFEEWNEPMISGLTWVSELIEAAGGDDIFADLAARPTAPQRIVDPRTVVERTPDIIIASWCGKPVRFDAIRARPGWGAIPAILADELHEVKSCYCLQPGPSLITEGLPRFSAIVDRWYDRRIGDD